ncbi:MAG: hypothetical protein OEY23_11650 [Acidimicrobiia bacterium]|nr:hypothetical protein [Acidimicrobiia bacterium]
MTRRPVPEPLFVTVDDPAGGPSWQVDIGFLNANWRCQWGRGCPGIAQEAAPELGRGCCSVGVTLADETEAMTTAALAECLGQERFQFALEARRHGIFADATRRATRVVDGACIFLNRPGFEGGAGCALHLAALDAGERPLDWKPVTCWQLPLRVEAPGEAGAPGRLRSWARHDWGEDAHQPPWWCTDAPEAYDGEAPVRVTLADELDELLGPQLAAAVQEAAERGR